MSSRSDRAARDVAHAERIRARLVHDGLAFRNLNAALQWFFPMRLRMSCPQGMSPRGEVARNGDVVVVSVDGGKGGDIDEVLATLVTVDGALEHLRRDYPRAAAVVVGHHRDGRSLRDQAKDAGLHHATMGLELARGEAYLVGRLKEAGVLV